MSVENVIPRRSLWAERVAYTNGMLLDQADFAADQDYHRGRLSMLARYLNGTGTLAGLEVHADPDDARRLVIAPGLALDRAGRIIQSPLPLCLHLDRWYEDRATGDPDTLIRAFRVGDGVTPDHVLCDVFIGFRDCEIAKRPAFGEGDFDALGAVAPLRLRDAVEATLVVRTEDDPPLPRSGIPDLTDVAPDADAATRRAALDALKRGTGWVEDIWWDDFDSGLRPDREHPEPRLAADIFLARITLAVTAGTPPVPDPATAPAIANDGRRMVYSVADLIALGT